MRAIVHRQGYIPRSHFRVNLIQEVIQVSWRSLVILLIFILGVILFLYGSNAYDATLGWSGLYLMAATVIIYLILEVYNVLRRRGS
jgi:hypothetical protein